MVAWEWTSLGIHTQGGAMDQPTRPDATAPEPDAPLDLLDDGVFGESEEQEEQVPPELIEEAALGSTPAGVATNEALRALSRAARSFLLYDPSNDAIRAFLSRYRDMMAEAFAFGTMELEIRPFEMVREGEVVYLERDRERSLAFRMFRDGVRRLSITPEVEWEELLRLLEILSIRYTGVRQQEDDIVTLLWKAGFSHIEIAAVEGFVPDNDDDDDDESSAVRAARSERRVESHIEAPHDWDTPLPVLAETGELVYRPIDEETLESLRAEGSSMTIAENSLRLVELMLLVVTDITDPTTIDDVVHLIEEVRDFLLAEGQLGSLTDMARLVQAALLNDSDRAEAILSTFTNERALRRIIHSIGKGSEEVPPELIELLDLVPTDHLSHLISLLRVERATAARTIMRKLITHYAVTRSGYLLKHLRTADLDIARDLLAAFAEALPEQAVEGVEAVAERADTELHYEMLRVLESAPFDDRVRKLLMDMLVAPIEDVRMKALSQLIASQDSSLFRELIRHVEARASSELKPKEAEMIGRVLVELNPKGAQRLLSEWIRPRNVFKRFGAVPGQKMLRWTAVSGVGRLPGDKNEKLIRWLSKQAGEDLHRHCIHTLFRRRKEGTVDV